MTSSELTLVPGILLAMPSLQDPNFHRTVILMLQHDDDGALGLILNRPTRHACGDVARSLDIDWKLDENRFISVGGPVEPQSLWMLHSNGWMFDETIQVGASLAVSRSERALRQMCQAGEEKIKMFVGYAGWGPGQLEQEIREGSWLTTELSHELVFETAEAEIWDSAFETLGVNPGYLVDPTETLH